jgi:hypothetical protein
MPRQNQWDTRSYPWQRRGEFLRSGWQPSIQSGTQTERLTLQWTPQTGIQICRTPPRSGKRLRVCGRGRSGEFPEP